MRKGLAGADIHIADEQRVSPAAHKWLKTYFLNEILPIITPQALDPAHPFPFVQNEGMGLLFTLTRDATREQLIEMVLIPSALPRFVRVPPSVTEGSGVLYISIARMIQRYAEALFPGFTIQGDGLFRVLRDSDIEIEEEAEDLVRTFRSAIQRRRRGQVIQLEIEEDFDPAAEALLLDQLGINEAALIKTDGMIGIDGLAENLPRPRAFASYPRNAAFEALAIDSKGVLYTLPEELTGSRRLRLFTGQPGNPNGPDFPIWRFDGASWTQPFFLPRSGNYLPVGADFGPDGRFYVLERQFRGIAGFGSRVRSFTVGAKGLGAERVEMESPIGLHDNLEGLSVWRDGTGAIRLTMISDNNFLPIQRTEIVEYRIGN